MYDSRYAEGGGSQKRPHGSRHSSKGSMHCKGRAQDHREGAAAQPLMHIIGPSLQAFQTRACTLSALPQRRGPALRFCKAPGFRVLRGRRADLRMSCSVVRSHVSASFSLLGRAFALHRHPRGLSSLSPPWQLASRQYSKNQPPGVVADLPPPYNTISLAESEHVLL